MHCGGGQLRVEAHAEHHGVHVRREQLVGVVAIGVPVSLYALRTRPSQASPAGPLEDRTPVLQATR
jgi:hypothetical protein